MYSTYLIIDRQQPAPMSLERVLPRPAIEPGPKCPTTVAATPLEDSA